MLDLPILDEHEQRKEDTFWWVFYTITLSVGMLIGISFVIAPIVLFIIFKSVWLLLPFLLVPLGILMVRGIYKVSKKLIWKNNHLSSYTLKQDVIEFEDWLDQTDEPEIGSIRLTSIDYVVFSGYIVREMMRYRQGLGPKSSKITETAPIIYVVYKANSGRKKVLTIPFHLKNDGLHTWLGYFQDHEVPLKFAGYVLYRNDIKVMNDEERLGYFENDNKLLSFKFEGDWSKQMHHLLAAWDRTFDDVKVVDDSDQTEAMKADDQKISAKGWVIVALRTYPIFIIGFFMLILLDNKGIITDEGFWSGYVLMALTAALYFHFLQPYLNFTHMIRFSIENVVICLLLSIIFEQTVAEDVSVTISGASFFFPAIVWIPFLIVVSLKRNK